MVSKTKDPKLAFDEMFGLVRTAQREEHQAWIRMFQKMLELLGMTEASLNDKKFRPIFAEIERWGWFNYQRIEAMKESGEWKDEWDATGIFWNGD